MRYRLTYCNINSGKEFSIIVSNSNDILPALKSKPQYVREPDNWECIDSEEVKED